MEALFHRIAPRLGPLILLAVALGCLFFLFELFLSLTSSGVNDLSAGNSSPGSTFEVSSGASLTTMLAAVTCIVLGAGAILLFRRWLKGHPGSPLWVMVCGGAPAVAMVGLGVYLLVSGARHGSPPYGRVPYMDHQVNAGGMEPLGLILLATIVIALMLVGIINFRFLLMPLVMCLVAILMFGLLGSSAVQGLNLFGYPSQLQPATAYVEEVNTLLQKRPAIDTVNPGKSLDPGVEDRVGGDTYTLEDDATGGLLSGVPTGGVWEEELGRLTESVFESPQAGQRAEAVSELARLADSAPLPRASVLSPLWEALGSDASPSVRAAAAHALGAVGDTGALWPLAEAAAGDDNPMVRTTAVEALAELGDPKAIAPLAQAVTDVDPGVQKAAEKALADLGATVTPLETGGSSVSLGDVTYGGGSSTAAGFPGNAELNQSQTWWPIAGGKPEIVVETPEPVGRGEALTLRGTVSAGSQPVPNTAVTVDGEQLARTDANGAFALRYPVTPDAALGTMPLELSAPALQATTTVLGVVKSATSLVVRLLERVTPGGPFQVEAKLLDDQGAGIPNATIHYGDGATATTGPDGVAKLLLPALEEEELPEVPLTVKFDGDESNLPVTHSTDVQVSSDDGFNWLLWVGLPLGLVFGSLVAYLVVRRASSFADLLRRVGGLVAFLLGGLSIRRGPKSLSDEEEWQVPALLDLSFPALPENGEKVWQAGELVSLRCVLTGESGEPIARATVEVDWGDSAVPNVLTTDRRGRCVAIWSAHAGGTYRVTARFAGDDNHSPVTAREEFRVLGPVPRHMTHTHLEIAFVKLAEDLPEIWGIGEQVQVEIALLDDSRQGLDGRRVTAKMGEPGQTVELLTGAGGRCHTAWAGTVPGTYRVAVDFSGEGHYLAASGRREFEVVNFREDVVSRYNSFLPWVREREPGISEQSTPREMEAMVVASGIAIDQRALEVVIARFEEADYSQHEIDRARFEAMYRARRRIVGD